MGLTSFVCSGLQQRYPRDFDQQSWLAKGSPASVDKPSRQDGSFDRADAAWRLARAVPQRRSKDRLARRSLLLQDVVWGEMPNTEPPRRRAAGQLEGETLAALWSSERAMTPAEVQRELGGDLAYTTVTTILSRLYLKGLVQRLPSGRGYAYRPVEGQEAYAAQQMRNVLDQGVDRNLVLQHFVESLQPDEELLVRRALEARTVEAED